MQVRPGGVARGADGADHLAGGDRRAVEDPRGAEVGVEAAEGRAVKGAGGGGEHRADHPLRRVGWPWWTVARRIERSRRWPRVSALVSRWAATLSAPGTLSMRKSVASA